MLCMCGVNSGASLNCCRRGHGPLRPSSILRATSASSILEKPVTVTPVLRTSSSAVAVTPQQQQYYASARFESGLPPRQQDGSQKYRRGGNQRPGAHIGVPYLQYKHLAVDIRMSTLLIKHTQPISTKVPFLHTAYPSTSRLTWVMVNVHHFNRSCETVYLVRHRHTGNTRADA